MKEIEYQVMVKCDGCWWAIGQGPNIERAHRSAASRDKKSYDTLPRRTVKFTTTIEQEIVETDGRDE